LVKDKRRKTYLSQNVNWSHQNSTQSHNEARIDHYPNMDTPIIHTITHPTKNIHNNIMKMKPEIDYSTDKHTSQ